ncbi:hypothetical protein ATANTOWER_017205 [Ataeniobius toweri]|uniref:Uncharacterized protein n=1 Tax=Ataeniobius toweri TaxID=208326 RepID=A0ABU7CHL1_9TELE|nr:hypothetical protein [Ataeniobius toweri]
MTLLDPELCLFASKETLACCVPPSSSSGDLRGRGYPIVVFFQNKDIWNQDVSLANTVGHFGYHGIYRLAETRDQHGH